MSKHDDCEQDQRHVHEFLGSTHLAELQEDPHNHRFAGVSGEAKGPEDSHFHKLKTRTDFFDHFHDIEVKTGPPIDVGNNKHVHFVKDNTEVADGHVHVFEVATLIDRPIIDVIV